MITFRDLHALDEFAAVVDLERRIWGSGDVDVDLKERIGERLKAKKFCVASGNEIARIWPTEPKERNKQIKAIQRFAKENGWTATILDPGIRVTLFEVACTKGVYNGA